MKIEKWKFNGKEVEIPILDERDIERNNIDDLEETKEFPIISDNDLENTEIIPIIEEDNKNE